MAKMKSRERVERALNHQETDRLPIDIGGMHNLTSIHRDAYAELQKHLGFDDPIVLSSVPSQSVIPSEKIRQRFKADCYPLTLCNPYGAETRPQVDPADGSQFYLDEWGIRWRCPKGGFYFDPSVHPLKEPDVDAVLAYPWPDPKNRVRFDGLRIKDRAKEIYENTDYAIVLGTTFSGGVWGAASWLMGMADFMMAMLTDEEMIQCLFDKIVEQHVGQWDLMLGEIGKYATACVMTDDLGAQNGPLFSPEVYRKFIKPAQKKIVDFIKSKADVKVIYHCDGAIDEFLPDIIDIGYDVWNPIQVSAKGMNETARLNRLYGDKICFWGGCCDSQNTLAKQTPEGVREEVRQRILDLGPGGGLIAASVHNVQRGTPVENIVALYDALYEYGTAFCQGRL